MQITCKHCGSDIPSSHMNVEYMIAKCERCDAVFHFGEQVPADQFDTARVERLKVELEGMTIEDNGYELLITRTWRGCGATFIIIFTLIWNSFMVIWFTVMIGSGEWGAVAFGLIFAAVGVYLLYYALAHLFNKTTIRVGTPNVEVRHGPIPWQGNKTLDSGSIKQIYCYERIHRGKNSTSFWYEIHAILTSGEREELVTGLDQTRLALYLEQEIERFLGIKDRPVRGELHR